MGKGVLLLKIQVKLAIYREIAFRRTCCFVSPKFCIGHPLLLNAV